jgi:hypothetical protein
MKGGTQHRVWLRRVKTDALLREDLGNLVEVNAPGVALDEHTEDVLKGEVRLLDVHRNGRRDDDVMVAELAHLAAAVTGEADGVDLLLLGLMQGAEDVLAVTRSGDAEEDVSGLGKRFNLTGEDLLERPVIADGGQDGGVRGEGDGAQGGAIDGEARDKLSDQMLRVGGRASVSSDQQLMPRPYRISGELADGEHRRVDFRGVVNRLHGGEGLGELAADEVFQIELALSLKRKLFVSKVTVAGDRTRVDDERQQRSMRLRDGVVKEEIGRYGKDKERRRNTDAVHGKTLQPFLEIIPMSAKNKPLIAKEGNRDCNGCRDNLRRQNHDGEVKPREEVGDGVDDQPGETDAEDSVESTHEEKPDDLRSWEDAAHGSERAVCGFVFRCLR